MEPTKRTRANWDDVAFASYLASLSIALVAGIVAVLTLDLEGQTKAAAVVGLLLPCLALIAVVVYALRNPLPRTRAPRRD